MNAADKEIIDLQNRIIRLTKRSNFYMVTLILVITIAIICLLSLMY